MGELGLSVCGLGVQPGSELRVFGPEPQILTTATYHLYCRLEMVQWLKSFAQYE
jgi:hypothetical protein